MSVPTAAPVATLYDCRQAFAEQLVTLASTDPRIVVVVVVNDSVGSSNLKAFGEQFADRLINVGIAEQDMVGVGAGLANAGGSSPSSAPQDPSSPAAPPSRSRRTSRTAAVASSCAG